MDSISGFIRGLPEICDSCDEVSKLDWPILVFSESLEALPHSKPHTQDNWGLLKDNRLFGAITGFARMLYTPPR